MSTLARRDAAPASDPAAPPEPPSAGESWAVLLVPAALGIAIVALAFSGGGFFAGATGVGEAVAAAALAAWIVLVPRPLAAISPTLGIAIAALGAFSLWVLVSSRWSHAPARALLEGDRALLYTLVVALVGLAAGHRRVRDALPRVIGAALVVVTVCGLVTRLLPHVWPIAADVEFERLSYPLGYWNGQGAFASLAAVLCLHLASDRDEPRWIRATAAGALPLMVTAVALTFSRGSIAVGLIGAVAYLLLARPRGAFAALTAAVPASVIAVFATAGSDAIIQQPQVSAAGVHAGARAAIVVVACALACAVAALLLARLEPRLDRLPWRPIPHARWVAGIVVVSLGAGSVLAGAPAIVADKAGQLTHSSHVRETGDTRSRLTQLSDNGRIDAWRVSLDGFSAAPLHGTGAGTFALQWDARRPSIQTLNDGHSLIFETLGELGVVGLALLVAALGALLTGAAMAARRSAVAAAGFAVMLAWTIHAAIDWDWELPALTVPALALAAATVARPRPAREPAGRRAGGLVRASALVALVVVGAMGAGIAYSQHLLDDGVARMRAGDCASAIRSANRAVSVDAQRPEPHQVLAVCALRAGETTSALAQSRIALRLDPANWRMAYDLAMVQSIAGQDPRPMLRRARRDNPRSWLLRKTEERFGWTERADWPAVGQEAGLLV
ncbi:MAG: O-antigen polymerase [Solirubrobacterales bacterium]|nr:O-antigen polymerase [Solirubrobacterales bacterium]